MIETPSVTKPIITTEPQTTSNAVSANQAANNSEQKTFKDELNATKDEKDAKILKEELNTVKSEKNAAAKGIGKTPTKTTDKKVIINPSENIEKNPENVNATVALVGNIVKNQTDTTKNSTKKDTTKTADKDVKSLLNISTAINPVLAKPLIELKTEIENINGIKNNSTGTLLNGKISLTDSIDANIEGKTIKMDSNDALFFANLIKKEQFSITDNDGTSEIKSEATQKSAQVSATLMTSISEAFQSNKPIRIDFGNNIAVIMKIDKDGKLSAEFIPGDKAVENYLKANVPLLQQSFDQQNLPYNSLSYRKQQEQKEQQEQQNNNKHKENDDE